MQRFVRALLAGGAARLDESSGAYQAEGGPEVRLGAMEVRRLVSAGVLEGEGQICRASPEARNWLRRQMLDGDGLAAQHRLDARGEGGALVNLAESPLVRLARPESGEAEPFLNRAQLQAGERVRTLVERAALGPKLTMSYDPTRIGGGRRGKSGAAEISDMAADARRALAELHAVLPRDCAAAVLDICGFLKGLQLVEAERGWPRRSAKLVLRIGLDQLARHYGIGESATGPEAKRLQGWTDGTGRPQGWP